MNSLKIVRRRNTETRVYSASILASIPFGPTPMSRPPYESELTKMMRELLAAKPQIVEEQKKGRSMWWDRKQTVDDQARATASTVPQKPYVYQTEN